MLLHLKTKHALIFCKETENKYFIADPTGKAAFTVAMSSASSSWNSGTLVFPAVVYNIGRGYDPNTGIFTAPVDGHFVFFVNIQSLGSNYVHVDIVHNSSPKVRAMASTPDYSPGSNLAVLRLQKGDRVWVEHSGGKGYHTHSDVPLTTFSGFLI
jgi:hypothetical protein